MIGSCHTVPVKDSAGARRDGTEPDGLMSMAASPLCAEDFCSRAVVAPITARQKGAKPAVALGTIFDWGGDPLRCNGAMLHQPPKIASAIAAAQV